MTTQRSSEETIHPWDSDHTALVHVLWRAKHRGLTLEKDCDEIAALIMCSKWLKAVQQHAVERRPKCEICGYQAHDGVCPGPA